MESVFKNLFVLGRPAAGKSEFIDLLKNTSDKNRCDKYHIGKIEILDDFPFLWEKCEEDNLWEKVGRGRLCSKRSDHAYVVTDRALYDFLIEKLNDIAVKKYLKENNFYKEHTLLVEFARGSSSPYKLALKRFDPSVLKISAILYVKVTGEESMRRNNSRYVEKLKSSILAHKTPDEEMENFYKTDDWLDLTDNKESGFIKINEVDVPFITMDNEPELKDPGPLGERCKKALENLWKIAADKK